MGKKLKVAGPATTQEVDKAYQQSQSPYERERLLAIRLGQQGQWTLEQIAQTLKRGRATIIRWVRAYQHGGIEGVLKRHYEGEREESPAWMPPVLSSHPLEQ